MRPWMSSTITQLMQCWTNCTNTTMQKYSITSKNPGFDILFKLKYTTAKLLEV